MRKIILQLLCVSILLLFSFPFFTSAQSSPADKTTIFLKDTLSALSKKMQRGENDSVRFEANKIFERFIESILNDSASFYVSLDSVKNVSSITAPDKSFRLYTWIVPNYEGSRYYYYGYVQLQNVKTKKTILYQLQDSTEVLEKPMEAKLSTDRWYGAVYYSVLKNSFENRNYYTLLGWKGLNQTNTQKVIDVLYFERGKPVFGSALFKGKKKNYKRVLFEFTAQANCALRYEQKRKLIVFDHLSNVRGINGPDGSYDAYKFIEGFWELIPDVDVNAGFKAKPQTTKPLKDEELIK